MLQTVPQFDDFGLILLFVALGMFVVERLWPANALPKIEAWWPRVLFVNLLQAAITFLAGNTWDRWLGAVSFFSLRVLLGSSSALSVSSEGEVAEVGVVEVEGPLASAGRCFRQPFTLPRLRGFARRSPLALDMKDTK